MAEMSPELRAATDAAKERIKVETYFPRAMNAGLKGNAQGFWSGTALGFLTGGLAGGFTVAGLAMASVATPLAPLAIVLGLAGIGGTMGGATGARIGAGSGAIASVAAERERRDRGEKLEQEILASPKKQREVIEAYRKDPIVEKNDTVKEIFSTTRGKGKAFGKMVNLPTFLICVAVCAVASMALFGGAFMLGGGATAVAASGNAIASGLGALGMKSMASALAIGAGAGGAMGAAFGIAYPPIFASFTKHVADLLSGKTVRGKSNFEHIKNIPEMEQEAARTRAVSATVAPVIQPVRTAYANETPALQVSDVQTASRMVQPEHALSV